MPPVAPANAKPEAARSRSTGCPPRARACSSRALSGLVLALTARSGSERSLHGAADEDPVLVIAQVLGSAS
jgi:hypothetical protein